RWPAICSSALRTLILIEYHPAGVDSARRSIRQRRGTAMSTATASRTGLTSKLREHFGFRRFRPGQEKVVRSALSGRDTLALMPTGSGKSLCFQLPGLVMEGSTVVISPLIALMKDQTESLAAKGISAIAFNSTMSPRERLEAEELVARGAKEFVYTTPEQLA